MSSSFWIDAVILKWSIVKIKESQVTISKLNCNFFSEDHFGLANSLDPDEMPHYAAFNLGHL